MNARRANRLNVFPFFIIDYDAAFCIGRDVDVAGFVDGGAAVTRPKLFAAGIFLEELGTSLYLRSLAKFWAASALARKTAQM